MRRLERDPLAGARRHEIMEAWPTLEVGREVAKQRARGSFPAAGREPPELLPGEAVPGALRRDAELRQLPA